VHDLGEGVKSVRIRVIDTPRDETRAANVNELLNPVCNLFGRADEV
jgi:hypothetical protein